ncbi:hypothetical protein ABT364_08365 [Massilia sp. SR12]
MSTTHRIKALLALALLATAPALAQTNITIPETHYDRLDPTELPATVPMSPEQRDYLIYIANALREAIEGGRSLGESDPVFGKGTFYWPKDPKKPIKTSLSFRPENFKMRSISVGFRRQSSKGPWESAALLVNPRNFPTGVYRMDLPESFFSDLVLLKTYSKKREHASLPMVNVFEFAPRQGNTEIRLLLETRPDLSNLDQKYPRSFHSLLVTR